MPWASYQTIHGIPSITHNMNSILSITVFKPNNFFDLQPYYLTLSLAIRPCPSLPPMQGVRFNPEPYVKGDQRLAPLYGRRSAKIADTKNRGDLKRAKLYARCVVA